MSRKCKENWHMGQVVAIDEMGVMYKGKYCAICQYLRSNLYERGLTVRCVSEYLVVIGLMEEMHRLGYMMFTQKKNHVSGATRRHVIP